MADRREFLKGIAAAGIGLGLSQLSSRYSLAKEETEGKAAGNAYRFDVHHHILPPEYVRILTERNILSLGTRFPPWSVEKTVEMMDKTGIRTAVVSVSSPAAAIGDAKASSALARLCNEFAARMMSDHPSRFGAFATLPLPDVEGSLTELLYALDTLKLDGVEMLTNYSGKYQGDSSFEPLYQELNKRKAVVHIHPGEPPAIPLKIPSATLEAPFDTTRAVANLLFTGTLEKYPDIIFIIAAGGGALPMVAERIANAVEMFMPDASRMMPKGVIAYIRKLYFDTALSRTNQYAYPSIHALVEESHLLFGSDWPFAAPLIESNIEYLQKSGTFTAQEKKGIEGGNALALFPRFQKKLSA